MVVRPTLVSAGSAARILRMASGVAPALVVTMATVSGARNYPPVGTTRALEVSQADRHLTK